ncbi:hypothetical protein ElyMa_000251500, partial [Elysia marginata]
MSLSRNRLPAATSPWLPACAVSNLTRSKDFTHSGYSSDQHYKGARQPPKIGEYGMLNIDDFALDTRSSAVSSRPSASSSTTTVTTGGTAASGASAAASEGSGKSDKSVKTVASVQSALRHSIEKRSRGARSLKSTINVKSARSERLEALKPKGSKQPSLSKSTEPSPNQLETLKRRASTEDLQHEHEEMDEAVPSGSAQTSRPGVGSKTASLSVSMVGYKAGPRTASTKAQGQMWENSLR